MKKCLLCWRINTINNKLLFNKKSNIYYMSNQKTFKDRFQVKYDVLKNEYKSTLTDLDKEKEDKDKYYRTAGYLQLQIDGLVKGRILDSLSLKSAVYYILLYRNKMN